MSQTLLNSRQTQNSSALENSIGASANSTLDTILSDIDTQMVNVSGTQTVRNKSIGYSVSTDSTTTGSDSTIQAFTSGVVRLTNASLSSVSGIPAGSSGQILVLENQSGNTISINNDDSGAITGARIYTGSGSDLSMQNNASLLFTYDTTSQHWMLNGVNAGGSSSTLPVGSVVSSMLTLTQYQGQAGTGWILSDGSTVSGSSYESITGQSSAVASNNASSSASSTPLIFSTPSVTTTGNSTASSNILTNIPMNTSIAVGQIVSATNIPYDSTLTSISQYTFALPGTNNGYQFAVHSSTVYDFAVHSSTVYIFTVTSANATAGATYTDNGQTFTVTNTIAGGTTLTTTGTGIPDASGTLTLSTGTGDPTITFSSFAYGGANATSGATYTNNGQTFTVTDTLSDGTPLITSGTGDPLTSGTLSLSTGTGDATIIFSSFAYGGANATAGDTYTNNGQTFTVTDTLSDGTTLVVTGTGVPDASGTLTKNTGSGDSNITFTSFTYLGHNATSGAVYTNNSQNFTVVNTLLDGITLVCTGTGYPDVSGTLTLSSGTGDSTIDFSSVAISVMVSNNATGTASGETIIFSDLAAETTGDITNGSPDISNIANTTGLATGQIISSAFFAYNTTVSSLTPTAVPNLQGMFLRGTGSQIIEGVTYSGAGLGQQQLDQVQGFGLSITNPSTNAGGDGTTEPLGGTAGAIEANQQWNLTTIISAGSQYGTPRAGNNTYPINYCVNYFIRIN